MENRKKITLSITAHVDAGKTTLAEAMLFEAGQIKKRGRVDHHDSSLDYEGFERARGITAFSKQAAFSFGNTDFSLIDTPGHAELFAETRRGLRVPDAAILVISGSEGVQADTGLIWQLLSERSIPTWIFVSKMDLPNADRADILQKLKSGLSDGVTDFTADAAVIEEEAAGLDEDCMEAFFSNGRVPDAALEAAIAARHVIPCFFGSGLHLEGVREFLSALDRLAACPVRPEAFSALCYKISRDARGQRLSQVKITGGRLAVRDTVRYRTPAGKLLEEKITGIRIYSGARFENAEFVEAGQICSLLGLSETAAGTTLGDAQQQREAGPAPVRRFRVCTEGPQDPVRLLACLRQLGEELPELQPRAEKDGVSVSLAGKIQGEMFKALLLERFDLPVSLQEGGIVYRETVTRRAEGIGHFEPLRHYAEVHLILEPAERGSGITLESVCPEDVLDRNWQNLILDALRGDVLPGVLTGSELTDVKICLASGRAHPKHTEGGDFREAARRALRHGLMQAESLLLEPILRFRIDLPPEQLGRAISDLRGMHATLENPIQEADAARITGTVPAGEIGDYGEALLSYTHGRGRLSLHPAGYQPCRDAARVIEESGYQPERDTDWPADSVFCAHGAGFQVSWQKVKDYMHLPSVLEAQSRRARQEAVQHRLQRIDDRELEEIMLREFGPVRRPQLTRRITNAAPEAAPEKASPGRQTLVIDGYNFIFAQPELKRLAQDGLSAARQRLMDRLSNFCGFTGREVVLVFDGFRTAGNPGARTAHANIRVVYTPEGETADAYIERLAAQIGKNDRVSVVTADTMIRISAMRSGVLRISPEEFERQLEEAEDRLSEILARSNDRAHQTRGADAVIQNSNSHEKQEREN